MRALERLRMDSRLVVHILVIIFAVSSWVDLNGMWVELPIFVTHLPEKWTLPSYISILGQVANIGPLIFILIAYCMRRHSASASSRLALDKVTAYIIMVVGIAACLLLAFFWQRTSVLSGEARSVALLALSFFLSAVDCTSSVAYVAFMAALKPQYMSSFFVGEGLSGLLPALMALGQGAGEIVCVNVSFTAVRNDSGQLENVTTYAVYPNYLPPRFSVQVFFLILAGMILLSLAAFILLNHWPYCRYEFSAACSYTFEHEPGESHADKRLAERQETKIVGDSPHGKWSSQNGISNPGLDFSDEGRRCKSQELPAKNVQDGATDCAHPSLGGDSSAQTHQDSETDRGDQPTGAEYNSLCAAGKLSYGARDITVAGLTHALTHPADKGSIYPGQNMGREGHDLTGACADEGQLEQEDGMNVSMATVLLMLGQVVIINFLIVSFLLNVQVYSSLPYGISTYNLVVTLSNIANPVACFISLFLAVTSRCAVGALTTVGVACGAYIVAAAMLSPAPPLMHNLQAGSAVVILAWVGASFFLTYAKISIAGVMRHIGRHALIWYGVATQLGALTGAIVGFVLVNEIKVFKDSPWC